MDTNSDYQLPAPEGSSLKLTRGWLYLAIGSLMAGGVLPLLLMAARVPGLYEHIPVGDMFRSALVVHVDLTVLGWFLAFAGVFFSINSTQRFSALGWAALILTTIGAVIFSLSPFFGAAEPLRNNYIPVLNHRIFLTGLTLFGAGYSMLIIRSLISSVWSEEIFSGSGTLRVGIYTATLASLFAILALFASFSLIPNSITGQHYYELLFWGGGHVLQFTHTQLLLVAWLWLATASGAFPALPFLKARIVVFIFIIGILPLLATPFIYAAHEIASADHRLLMTSLMEYGNSIGPFVIGLAITIALFKSHSGSQHQSPLRIALIMSILLFATGGIIGLLISGINVTIPAHYHGSIGGIVLAYMGMTYYLLPILGFNPPHLKMAKIQPIIYGSGQLMHVFGLALSGGYGVQRKTAGAEQALDSMGAQIGMKIVGLGGLIAVIGGLMFAIVVLNSILKSRSK
jgi:cytochrome c oxidase subunit 1